MLSLQNLKDILMFKESTAKIQDVFENEFYDMYRESDRDEKAFLENSVDQIFRKYYYSAIQPETYITPANIISILVEKEITKKPGRTGKTEKSEKEEQTEKAEKAEKTDEGKKSNENKKTEKPEKIEETEITEIIDITDITRTTVDFVFFPKITLTKQKGVLSKIQTNLHYVNTQKHHMVDDMVTVLEICKKGIRVNNFGIIEDSERKKLNNKLFFNDRHYQNTIVLVAISLGYMKMVKEKNKTLAITTEKSNEFINMKTEYKIKYLVEGIIGSFIRTVTEQFPKLENILEKDTVWQLIKNPANFPNFLDTVNNKFGLSFELIEKAIYESEKIPDPTEQLKNLIDKNPSAFQIYLFTMMLDIYLFTPLGYYMQLIKPYYSTVYNIVFELGEIFNILEEDYRIARNMLFSMPDEFDLTPLGEKIILDGKKSKRSQVIPKKYNDKKFLECFEIRERYLEEELLDAIEDFNRLFEYQDEYDKEHDDEYGEEIDDEHAEGYEDYYEDYEEYEYVDKFYDEDEDEYYDEYDDEYDDKYNNEYEDGFEDEYDDDYENEYEHIFKDEYIYDDESDDKKNAKISTDNEDNVIDLMDYYRKKGYNNGKKKYEK